MGFPGHWAPNDLVFNNGDQFPERYKNGAFIALQGSTNRAPYPQTGYFVGFVPFQNGKSTGQWEVFADGFAGVDPIVNVNDAIFRPMGIAVGPDGSLYISDSVKGRIWKVSYRGDKDEFGAEQLAAMEEHKKLSHIRTPDLVADNLMKEDLTGGEAIYAKFCSACHQTDGTGASGRFPPLAGTDWVSGDKERLITLVMRGMEGDIEVNGEQYSGVMPQHAFLSDEEIADVLTYIRSSFGNSATAIKAEEVAILRAMPLKTIQ
jgi:mono/diheme cytochrome c family protein